MNVLNIRLYKKLYNKCKMFCFLFLWQIKNYVGWKKTTGLGYTSEWAKEAFCDVVAKKDFFEELGCLLEPSREELLNNIPQEPTPKQILDVLDT